MKRSVRRFVRARAGRCCEYCRLHESDQPLLSFHTEHIIAKLKIGLESLSSYVNHDGLLMSTGADVIYEHSETWGWSSGETVVLPFVSVPRVEDGKISLWKDYSDFNTLTSAAPQSYLETWASIDTSWIFDATGMV